MLQRRQREVDRKYGEGVDQQFVLAIHHTAHLLLRTMLATKETRTLADTFGVNLGPRRAYAGRIPLSHQRDAFSWKLTGLDAVQLTIALSHIIPRL